MERKTMVPISARIRIGAGLVAIGFLIAWNWQANKYDKRLADQELAYSVASAKAVQSALIEQQRRYESMESVSDEGDKTIETVRADSAAADHSADRLREELTAVRARARRELSSAATQRATDRQTIVVLTELYESSDRRARELSAAFDESHARGLNCEAAYTAVCGN